MKDAAKDVVRERRGPTNFTFEQLVVELIPYGQSIVPSNVKEELQDELRRVIREQC